MMIDSLAGVPLPGVLDIKAEKKINNDEVRPIEESGDSPDSGLDINKDKVTRHRNDDRSEERAEIESYNARGEAVPNNPSPDRDGGEEYSIDLEV